MQAANKRIAKNTAFMYVRLFTAMVIGLYTSRLVLEVLGVSDYGLFAVVGGVLAIFTFISSSLSTATSRFFNIEMGRGSEGDVNSSFCINIVLHTTLALLILLLSETVGLWYVYYYLNVPEGRLDDALFVYHVSIFTACLGIINNPYQSMIMAHERFSLLAGLDIVNSFVRLACVVMLTFYHGPYALRLYSIIFSLTTVNLFVVYHVVAHRRWPSVVRFRLVRGWLRYREVLSFGCWNVLATLAYTARSSGSDLLLNSFFGTAMNGAFAISKTVNTCITTFTGSFDNASAPQIIQSYAAHDKPRYTYLCNKLGRISLLMFELIAFPLLVQLDFVLHLWLGQVPPHALTFCVLYIISGGIALSCGGIYNLMNATANIKWFKMNSCFFFLMCIPVGYVLFRYGFPAYTILVLFLIADVLQRIVQLVLMKHILGFDAWLYVKKAYVRPAVIALLLTGEICVNHLMPVQTNAEKFASIVFCLMVTAMLIFYIGLEKDERSMLLSVAKGKMKMGERS